MKMSAALFAVVLAFAATSAFAQDAAPTPAAAKPAVHHTMKHHRHHRHHRHHHHHHAMKKAAAAAPAAK